jgi:hypothetical protein
MGDGRAATRPGFQDRSEGQRGPPEGGVRLIEIRPRERFWVTLDTDRAVYDVGESVQVRFRASQDCVVYIFNTDSDGVTRQIFPNYFDRDNSIRANRQYSIPDRRYLLVTTGPPGRESLHIMAYSRKWRALEPWNEFRPSDPFPRRGMGGAEMRQRVEDEARKEQEIQPGSPGGRGGGLRIVPVPPERYYDYAEDRTHFRVEWRRYEPPHPFDPRDPWRDARPSN